MQALLERRPATVCPYCSKVTSQHSGHVFYATPDSREKLHRQKALRRQLRILFWASVSVLMFCAVWTVWDLRSRHAPSTSRITVQLPGTQSMCEFCCRFLRADINLYSQLEQYNQCTYNVTIDAWSCNYCCSGKAVSVTQHECVCLQPQVSSTQWACAILSSVTCLALQHFFHIIS